MTSGTEPPAEAENTGSRAADVVAATAQRGFGADPGRYDRGRPSYPADAVDFVVQAGGLAGRRVVDVGAGTGKMTALLVDRGVEVVAVEPVAAMRDQLRANLPQVEVVDGTAEQLALPDESAAGIVVAQAFHWMDAPVALGEFARVLSPGGLLALVWNSRDARVPWVAEMSRIIRWNSGEIPTYDAGDEQWIQVLDRTGLFTPAEMTEFGYEHLIDRDGLVDRAASVSYIAEMPEVDRRPILDQVRALAGEFDEPFPLPYRTFVYWCHRR